MAPEHREGFNTLLCFVLVDPQGQHVFTSRYDFGPWPLLKDVKSISNHALDTIRNAKALMVNGFLFDELPPTAVAHACKVAHEAGTLVIFDAGPRAHLLLSETEEERKRALLNILEVSDAVLCTLEEAQAITGADDPQVYPVCTCMHAQNFM